jgi:hypothetical protein
MSHRSRPTRKLWSARSALVTGAFAALLCGTALGGATRPGARDAPAYHVLQRPFQAWQQTALGFGQRSHWLQPWRGYLETVPASRVSHALGIDYNLPPARAGKVARQLAAAGFHRVRYEIGWCSVGYSSPGQLTNAAAVRTVLQAFEANHLRPLVLLNAYEGCPGPLQRLQIQTASAAHAGDRRLQLTAASARDVRAGLTGLDSTTSFKAAATLFTAVSGTIVTLSRPLDRNLPAGSYQASTLRYAPFGQVGTTDFERTMQGWLSYVGTVTRTVESILGSDAFDVEVWNELSFGSDFLDANTYYSPRLAHVSLTATTSAILRRTVAYLRDPAHGVAHVGIGDGFTNQEPFGSGATVPAGVTALDKHPYAGPIRFPQDAVFNGVRPLDALGRPEGWRDPAGRWHDSFVPTYTAFFPEYYLTGIQTETMIRDLSPITTPVYGTPHGRFTHPPGAPAPTVWVTETALDPGRVPASALPCFKAKEALRYLTSWVNKGAGAVYLFAAGDADRPYGLVDTRSPAGGAALRALGRLTRTLHAGAGPITRRRSVGLASVADRADRTQFGGDGTPAHPALHDRDAVGFFPYQVSNRRVAIATYVMTRDLKHVYRPRLPGGDPRRYDLPPETFRLTITGVRGLGAHLRATDPATGKRVPIRVLRRRAGTLVVQLPLTDSPRLLIVG